MAASAKQKGAPPLISSNTEPAAEGAAEGQDLYHIERMDDEINDLRWVWPGKQWKGQRRGFKGTEAGAGREHVDGEICFADD